MLSTNAPVPAFQMELVETDEQISRIRDLFLEYAQSLGFSLCFQNFDQELASLPGDYAPPDGRLLLAMQGEVAAGCVALHQIDADHYHCEMKRLYVRPQFRGMRLGLELAQRVIDDSRKIGYKSLPLHTAQPQ